MSWKVPLSDVDFDSREEEAVLRVLRSKWLTMGEETEAFEREFAAMVGVPHAIAVANGTAALEIAYRAAGIGPGDTVIVPALTFVATANAARQIGATVRFADVASERDWNIAPAEVDRLAEETKAKAVVAVHYGGHPCRMKELREIAERRGLLLLEDSAHAIGARYGAEGCGGLGRAGAFSFFSNKNLVVGEGGMVTTVDAELAQRARHLRSHGMTTLTLDRHRGRATSYDVVTVGWNYRIDEIRSSIGRVQLSKLAANNERRRRLAGIYAERLSARAPEIGIPFRETESGAVSSHHLMVVLLPEGVERAGVMAGMKEAGVQSSIHYPPIHGFSAYSEWAGVKLPVTDRIAPRVLTLPLFPTMADDMVDRVVDALASAVRCGV